MATKTISLELDAYEKLKKEKRSPRESFSSVVRRARWIEQRHTGAEAIAMLRELSSADPEVLLGEAVLAEIEKRAMSRGRRERPEVAKDSSSS